MKIKNTYPKLVLSDLKIVQDQAITRLEAFAKTSDFQDMMTLSFGTHTFNYTQLQSNWLAGNIKFPSIEILTHNELKGAYGAFSQDTGHIYLAQELLSPSLTELATSVLLEEYGHFIDSRLNTVDSQGDEGAIFSALVQGKILSDEQLQQLQTEDDSTTINLHGQAIEVEQGSVSGSGGYEGSNQTIKLDSKGGGTATFFYEHYGIPDQFIIRYEGKELLNTGFVSNSRSGTVEIPKGNSDELQVIVATNNSGTAWNYNVTTESCPDSKPFIVKLVGGECKDTDKNGSCEGTGTIYIGRSDGIAQMLKVDGKVEYTDSSIKVDGIVYSMIGAGQVKSVPLFQGKFTIDTASGVSPSFQETGHLPNEYTLGGLPVNFNGLTMNANGLALGAKFKLVDKLGFPDSFLSGSDALLISQNDVDFGQSFKASLPNIKDFKLFKFVPVKEFSDFSIEYVAPEDKIKIQGKLVIDDFTKTEKFGKVTFDLASDNSIEIQGGKADIKGTLSAETNLNLIKGWGLKELALTIDTKNHDVGGSAKIEFPFKAVIPPGNASATAELGFKTPIPPLELNKVAIKVDNLNVPIPGQPEVFLQRISGSLDNLARSDKDAIEFSGGVGLTLGPKYNLHLSIPLLDVEINKSNLALIKADFDGTISSEKMTGKGDITVIDSILVNGNGNFTFDWNKKFLEYKGGLSLVDGLIKSNGGFKVDSNFNINTSGTASVNVPKFIPWVGGAQIGSGNMAFKFSNDGNLANDYAAGWGTVDIQKLGVHISFVAGFKVYFDGTVDTIGTTNIPNSIAKAVATPSGIAVESNTKWILLGADWQNSVAHNVPVQITMPDGTVINEADFAANNMVIVDELSNDTTKVVMVLNPQKGNWNIDVINQTGLGAVTYSTATDSVAPTIEVTSPAVDVGGGKVTIDYKAFDSDSKAQIALFYDTNNKGFDGIQITDGLIEKDATGHFVWNTQGVPTGNYFIYAMITDENNPPVFDYSPARVKVVEKADLSVSQTASLNPTVGENLTYTITVKNNGVTDSKNVILTETLPDNVTFVSSSTTPVQNVANILTFNLGNLKVDAIKTFDIVVTAPQTPTTVMATAHVDSSTFDPNATNSTYNLTTNIKESSPSSTDLSVTKTDKSGSVNFGEQYTYSIIVANKGLSTATNVVLTENLPSTMNFINSTHHTQLNSADSNFSKYLLQLGNIESGKKVAVDFTVSSLVAGDLVATTNVSSDETDNNLSNNSLISSKTIYSVAPSKIDLELTQTSINTTPAIGEQITLNITLTNKGPGTATAIQVQDLLPAGLKFVSAQPEQGQYDSSTGIWDIGNMRDNLIRTLKITAIVENSGSLTNTAEITSVFETDLDSTPNNHLSNEDDISVLTLNSAPIATAPVITSNGGQDTASLSVSENQSAITQITATDADANSVLTFSINGGVDANLFSIDNKTGSLLFKTSPDFENPSDTNKDNAYEVSVQVSDGSLTDTQNLKINVSNILSEIYGSSNQDVLFGSANDDFINGLAGNDFINAWLGNDTIYGGEGNDLITAGIGNDVIYGGIGNDILSGGTGADIFYFSQGDSHDVITDFDVEDKINIASSSINSFSDLQNTMTQVGMDTIIKLNNADDLVLKNIGISSLNTSDFFFV